MSGTSGRAAPLLRGIFGFFEGWRFPAFMLAALAFLTFCFLAVLLVPAGDGALGAFARDFKVWCFRYDPATGSLEWSAVFMMVMNPAMLATILLFVWHRPLAEALKTRRAALARTAAAALVASAGVVVTLTALSGVPAGGGTPEFPAAGLRTEIPAPDLDLLNHEGQPVCLAELEGRVVLLTAVYATCGYTCPMIMGQAQRAVAALDPAERASLTVIGVTLDPEHDTPAVLAAMAEAQGIATPLYQLATGEPARVERVLDQMGVARRRDPETGIIDHANVFLLVDRRGRVAYRFSLGELQESWLIAALHHLIAEPSPPGSR